MPDFPELGSGTVHGRFLAGTLDSSPTINPLADGPAPDAEPLGGSVTFTATAPLILVTSADPEPVSFFPQPLTVELDSEGYLSRNGSRDIQLWATNDPQGNPIDWQWHVHFSLTYRGRGVYRQPFNFFLPEGTIVDLTVVAPLIELSNGTIIIQGPPGESASDLINAQGDLITGDTAGDAAILPVGPEGSYLAPEPAAPLGLEWKPFPVPEGGLKAYASMAEVDAVRTGEVGTLHVDNLAAAFPNLAAAGYQWSYAFSATGPADLVITSQATAYFSPPPEKTVYQTFDVGDTFSDPEWTVWRILNVKANGDLIGSPPLWNVLPRLPMPLFDGYVPYVFQASYSMRPSTPLPNPNSLIDRDAEGRAQIVDPAVPADIANKGYVDGAIGAIPPSQKILTGSGAPDSSVGDPGDFYVDTDTDTLYGPKLTPQWTTEPPLLAGVPEGFPPGNNIEAGVKFTTTVDGRVSAVRIYQYPDTIGNGTAVTLWDAAGVALATGSSTITAHDLYVEVPLSPPTELPAGEYAVSYSAYRPMSRSEASPFPLVGGSVTLTGAVRGPGGSAPTTPETGNYWAEPVFQTPASPWPIAIAPSAGGGIPTYPDIATARAVTVPEIGILHVDSLSAAFPELALLDPLTWGRNAPADLIFQTEILPSSPPGNVYVVKTVSAYNPLPTESRAIVVTWWEAGQPYFPDSAFALLPYLPDSNFADRLAISSANNGPWSVIEATPLLRASAEGALNTVVRRDPVASTFEAGNPVNPLDVVNKQTMDLAIGAIPPAPPEADASETVKGIARYSTQAEVDAGVDLDSTVRPGTLAPYVAGQIAGASVPPHTHPELGGTHRFLFDATPAGDPGTGRISIENAGGQNRHIRVSKTDADGDSIFLAPLAVNDSIALAADAAAPTIYARGYAATVATDSGTFWEFTAVRESGVGALPADGSFLVLNVTMANGAGSSVPAGDGLKIYADRAALDAVREAEVGVFHTENLALEFPNLSAMGSGVEYGFATQGPADLIVTTVVTAMSTLPGKPMYLQFFDVPIFGDGAVRVQREWTGTTPPPALFEGRVNLPSSMGGQTSYVLGLHESGVNQHRYQKIFFQSDAWAQPGSLIMRNVSTGLASIMGPPVNPEHIPNKQYVDDQITAAIAALRTELGLP